MATPAGNPNHTIIKFKVYGKIQGTNFRKYTADMAQRLALSGYVMNNTDEEKTISGVAKGPSQAIEVFKEWVSTKGAPKAKISKCDIEYIPLGQEGSLPTKFQIRELDVIVKFRVFGKVRGTGFRACTSEEAKKLSLLGYVIYNDDPELSISGLVKGQKDNVEKFKEWVSITGSPKSRITKCDFTDVAAGEEGELKPEFEIRERVPVIAKFRVFGKVQGTDFRKYTAEKAEKLTLTGYVTNNEDEERTVGGVVKGAAEAVDEFKEWVSKTGSPKCKITSCDFVIITDGSEGVLKPEFEIRDSASTVNIKFQVFGKVQGTDFRKYAEETANKLGLVGYIMNNEDTAKSISGEVKGPSNSIEIFKEWVSKTGSPKCKITKCTITVIEDNSSDINRSKFEIRK